MATAVHAARGRPHGFPNAALTPAFVGLLPRSWIGAIDVEALVFLVLALLLATTWGLFRIAVVTKEKRR